MGPLRQALLLAMALPPPRTTSAAPVDAFSTLRGEYGFLSNFDSVTEEEVRHRVRFMQAHLGVMEFELFNAFQNFSAPPPPGQESWKCAYFGGNVRRRVLAAAAAEVASLGARSWLRVDPAGTDPGDEMLQSGFTKCRTLQVSGAPLKDLVAPNGEWAARIVPRWAEFAASLNVSGLLWATDVMQRDLDGQALDGVPEFLRVARPLLERHGVAQAWIFRDRQAWDLSLRGEVAFPYFAAWTADTRDWFLRSGDAPGGSVFSCFTGVNANHTGEPWNQDAVGFGPLDLGIRRWQEARCRGGTFLFVGDGVKYTGTDSYTRGAPMNQTVIEKVVREVFDELSCANTPGGDRGGEVHDRQRRWSFPTVSLVGGGSRLPRWLLPLLALLVPLPVLVFVFHQGARRRQGEASLLPSGAC